MGSRGRDQARSSSRTCPTCTAGRRTSSRTCSQRAIMEINALEPDVVVCSGDLTTFGYKQEYRQAREYLEPARVPRRDHVPGNHDSRNVGHVHFEELIGPRVDRPAQGRHHLRGGRLVRARPRPRHGRPRTLPVDRGAVCAAGRLPRLRPAPPPAADPRHGPRAKRRPRRRRHARGAPAGEREPRALRPQARALRVAARGPLRRQRRHGLVAAPARQHPALLQRRRDRPDRGRASTASTRSTAASA